MSVVNLVMDVESLRIPDRITQDILTYLEVTVERPDVLIELPMPVTINASTPIEIITIAFFREYYDIGFGDCVRVLAAVGGLKSLQYGIAEAELCFATVYYNEHMEAITVDFHHEFR